MDFGAVLNTAGAVFSLIILMIYLAIFSITLSVMAGMM